MREAQGDPGDEVTFLPFEADEIAPQIPKRPQSQGELDEARAELHESRRGAAPGLSAEEAAVLREGEIMKGFIAHPGWTILIRIVNAQMETGIRKLLEPSTGDSAALAAEFAKGVLQGFRLFAATPQGMINTAEGLRSAHNLKG